MNIDIATEDGDVEIRETDLPLAEAVLEKLGITKEQLDWCFEEAKRLMQGVAPRDRIRPLACQHLDGTWEVIRGRYSEHSDPLMQGPAQGNA